MHFRRSKTSQISVKQGTAVPCFYFCFTSSTNYLAKAFVAENSLKTPLVVVAKEQSAGRGRYDRTFLSPKGGVYMTYVAPAGEDFLSWSLYGAVAVVRVLSTRGVNKDRLGVKWPNDVNLDGKKVCGILPESVVNGDRFVLLGIGVNVNTKGDDLAPIKDIATSVYEATGKKHSIAKVTKLLTKELYSLTNNEDKDAVLDEYKSYLETLGREICTADGVKGVAVGITCDGALVVECNGQTKQINWGEVCYVK